MTELAWVYVIDVTLLAEKTNLLASTGTLFVFCSALAVLRVSNANQNPDEHPDDQTEETKRLILPQSKYENK